MVHSSTEHRVQVSAGTPKGGVAKIPGGQRDESQGTFARGKPGGVFFWQQRGEVSAKLPLSIKRYWRRPTRAGAWGERLFPNEEEGHQEEDSLNGYSP